MNKRTGAILGTLTVFLFVIVVGLIAVVRFAASLGETYRTMF